MFSPHFFVMNGLGKCLGCESCIYLGQSMVTFNNIKVVLDEHLWWLLCATQYSLLSYQKNTVKLITNKGWRWYMFFSQPFDSNTGLLSCNSNLYRLLAIVMLWFWMPLMRLRTVLFYVLSISTHHVWLPAYHRSFKCFYNSMQPGHGEGIVDKRWTVVIVNITHMFMSKSYTNLNAVTYK